MSWFRRRHPGRQRLARGEAFASNWTRAPPDLTASERAERLEVVVDWLLAIAGYPTESRDATRVKEIVQSLLEAELARLLYVITAFVKRRVPAPDGSGYIDPGKVARLHLEKLLALPTGWDTSERHAWRLGISSEMASISGIVLGSSAIALLNENPGADPGPLTDFMKDFVGDWKAEVSAGYCGLPQCPDCTEPD